MFVIYRSLNLLFIIFVVVVQVLSYFALVVFCLFPFIVLFGADINSFLAATKTSKILKLT